MEVIIVSPSLDPTQNVSGISSVAQFIITNNLSQHYIHFELGRKDNEKGGICRAKNIINSLLLWYKMLNKYPEAIIHYNFPLSKLSILRDPLFIMLAQWKKRKMIIHMHGGFFLTAIYIPKYLRIILNCIFSLEVPFIVLSSLEKKLLLDKFHCHRVYVLPNCVDLNDAAIYHRDFSQGRRPLVLGYLGRIAETKGMDYLLEACYEMKQHGFPFILKIAGKEEIEGQYLFRFQEELEDSFVYEGVVSGNSKKDFLKGLDLFILPSFFEGLPMSLIESMSYGVIPVTTNVGSIGEVIEDCENGLFIKRRNAKSIVEQCYRIDKDRKLFKLLSQKAKDTIFEKFVPQKYIDNLNSIYADLH